MRFHRRPASCRHLTRPVLVQPLEPRRLLAAGGALDTTFSGGGIARANPPGEAFVAADLCLQSDGKTVVVGNSSVGLVLRYNVDGSLDTGFGLGGFARLPMMEEARGVAMQGNSIIVVGDVNGGVDITHPAIARLNPNGTLDPFFAPNGVRVVDVAGTNSHANDVVVQLDSRIVVAASSRIGAGTASDGDDDFIAIRLVPNGSIDTPFGGGDGITEIDFTGARDEALSVALDYTVPTTDPKYGSIFLAGFRYAADDTGSRFAVAKLTPAGLLDNSFDGNGQLTTAFPSRPYSAAYGALVQPGSKLVVTGFANADPSFFGDRRNFITTRYLANGAIDTTFGPGGTGFVETDLGGRDSATGIVPTLDGGLLVGGSRSGRIAMVAYTRDGVIDPRFSSDDGIEVYQQAPVGGNDSIQTPNVKVAATGSTINPVRRILATGGSSGQTIRVVDVAATVTITAVDAEASETNSNTASFRVSRGIAGPNALRVRLAVSGTAIAPDDDRFTHNEDYNATDIVFGDGVSTPNYIDIPAGLASVFITITAVDDAIVEGDESATFSIASKGAYDIGSPSSTSIIIRDNETQGAPFTVSSAFLYETLPLQATFTFSQNVGASLGIDDFVLSAGLPTPTLSYNKTLNTAALSWSAPLPDGTYSVRANASGITNSVGTHLNADRLNLFGFLNGDANRDGTVDFGDLVILAQNYGTTGRTFSQGNFDYSADGSVDFPDLVIIAQRYGVSLSTLAPVSRLGGVKPFAGKRPSDGLLD